MLKPIHELSITPDANELKAQFHMLCRDINYVRGIAQNYRLTFKHKSEDFPAMLNVEKTPWIIMEQYADNEFTLIAINSSNPDKVKLISDKFLAEILRKIHEGECDLLF